MRISGWLFQQGIHLPARFWHSLREPGGMFEVKLLKPSPVTAALDLTEPGKDDDASEPLFARDFVLEHDVVDNRPERKYFPDGAGKDSVREALDRITLGSGIYLDVSNAA